jgi:hypothetical protein
MVVLVSEKKALKTVTSVGNRLGVAATIITIIGGIKND